MPSGHYRSTRTEHTAPAARTLPNCYLLDVVAPNVDLVVAGAGGWLFDRVRAGWRVRVIVAERSSERPLNILGVSAVVSLADVDADDPLLAQSLETSRPATVAVYGKILIDHRVVRDRVASALRRRDTEIVVWGEAPTNLGRHLVSASYDQISIAARVFKTHAAEAAGLDVLDCARPEMFARTPFGSHSDAFSPAPISARASSRADIAPHDDPGGAGQDGSAT